LKASNRSALNNFVIKNIPKKIIKNIFKNASKITSSMVVISSKLTFLLRLKVIDT
jgi:hypothetical protein